MGSKRNKKYVEILVHKIELLEARVKLLTEENDHLLKEGLNVGVMSVRYEKTIKELQETLREICDLEIGSWVDSRFGHSYIEYGLRVDQRRIEKATNRRAYLELIFEHLRRVFFDSEITKQLLQPEERNKP